MVGDTGRVTLREVWIGVFRNVAARGALGGRCHSATQEAAASSRVTVTAMALGEAAGCAAALAVRGKTDVGVFDGVMVREALGKQGGGPFTDA